MTDPNAPHRTDANVEPEREHATHEPEATAECAEPSPEAPQNIVPPWLRPSPKVVGVVIDRVEGDTAYGTVDVLMPGQVRAVTLLVELAAAGGRWGGRKP